MKGNKTPEMAWSWLCALALFGAGAWMSAHAAPVQIGLPAPQDNDVYLVQPGDILHVTVWREADMQLEVLVRPDGSFSIPLAGEIVAKNKSAAMLTREISDKLQKYMPDLSVTVGVKQPAGNKVYVIGKVNQPGEFIMTRPMDVMQALTVAGGLNKYAAPGDIKIIRRENGEQTVFHFDYGDIEDGDHLKQNIMLRSGDLIIVP